MTIAGTWAAADGPYSELGPGSSGRSRPRSSCSKGSRLTAPAPGRGPVHFILPTPQEPLRQITAAGELDGPAVPADRLQPGQQHPLGWGVRGRDLAAHDLPGNALGEERQLVVTGPRGRGPPRSRGAVGNGPEAGPAAAGAPARPGSDARTPPATPPSLPDPKVQPDRSEGGSWFGLQLPERLPEVLTDRTGGGPTLGASWSTVIVRWSERPSSRHPPTGSIWWETSARNRGGGPAEEHPARRQEYECTGERLHSCQPPGPPVSEVGGEDAEE